jgi:hypothetical protein
MNPNPEEAFDLPYRIEITKKQLAQAISNHPGSRMTSIPAVLERKRRIERLEKKLCVLTALI